MVSLISHILELNRYLPRAKTGQKRRLMQQDIDAMDVRIDERVYGFCGLTADEIAVVEETVGRNILRRKIAPDPEKQPQRCPGNRFP